MDGSEIIVDSFPSRPEWRIQEGQIFREHYQCHGKCYEGVEQRKYEKLDEHMAA